MEPKEADSEEGTSSGAAVLGSSANGAGAEEGAPSGAGTDAGMASEQSHSSVELPVMGDTYETPVHPATSTTPLFSTTKPKSNSGDGTLFQDAQEIPVRERINLWLNTTVTGQVFEIFEVLLSMAACGLFVLSTYMDETSRPLMYIDLVISGVFLIYYVLHLFVAPNKVKYIFGVTGLIDVLTIPSGVLQFFIHVNFLQVLRMLRVLRLAKAMRLILPKVSLLAYQLAEFGLTLFSVIFIMSGILGVVEPATFSEFHTALYTVVITLSTVGFGDVTPKTNLGRLSIVVFVVIAIVIVPVEVNKLMSVIALVSPYKFSYPRSKRRRRAHVLVTGRRIGTHELSAFLEEFFHSDRLLRRDFNVLVLCPRDPPPSMKALLADARYDKRVRYMNGNPLHKGDLAKAALADARACFVLAQRDGVIDANAADRETVLSCLAIKRYCSSVTVSAQVINQDNKMLLQSVVEHAVCLDELRIATLLKSVDIPGFSALLFGCFTNRTPTDTTFDNWQKEYIAGMHQETYACPVPPGLVGMRFTEAASVMYLRYSVLLYGISVMVSTVDGMKAKVFLNPGSVYMFEGNEVCLVFAYDERQVTALNEFGSTVENIASWDTRHIRRHVFEVKDVPSVSPTLLMTRSPTPEPNEASASLDTFQPMHDVRVAGIKNHVLVCGPITRDTARILDSLLGGTTANIVVFLTDSPLTHENLRRLGSHLRSSRFHVVNGSCTMWADLKVAGVETAQKVLLLTRAVTQEDEESSDATLVSDSDVILAWHNIISHCTKIPHVVFELNNHSNTTFLLPRGANDDATSSTIDPMVLPCTAGGRVVSLELFFSLSIQPMFDPFIIPMAMSLILTNQLRLIDTTEHPVQTYGELVRALLERNLVPLGLLRVAHSSPEPYVLLNPPHQTSIHAADRVYVLNRTTDPSLARKVISPRPSISLPPGVMLAEMAAALNKEIRVPINP